MVVESSRNMRFPAKTGRDGWEIPGAEQATGWHSLFTTASQGKIACHDSALTEGSISSMADLFFASSRGKLGPAAAKVLPRFWEPILRSPFLHGSASGPFNPSAPPRGVDVGRSERWFPKGGGWIPSSSGQGLKRR